MNPFLEKGDISGLTRYLANLDPVTLEDVVEDVSYNMRKKVLVLDILKMKVPNRSISRFSLDKM